jgi:hypothetical protein
MVIWVTWLHYGPNAATNIYLDVTDVDRRVVTNKWLDQHPGGLDQTYRQLFAEDHRDFFKAEVDKSGAGFDTFPWIPLNLDHQHYQVAIKCHDGAFGEDLWLAPNGKGGAAMAIRLSQFTPYTPTGQEKILFKCANPGFPSGVAGFASKPPSSCAVVFSSHLGEPQLPLQLPPDNRIVWITLTIELCIIAVILYSDLALRWMGVSPKEIGRV